MADQVEIKETPAVPETITPEKLNAEGSDVCQAQNKSWFKGMLPMAICCGAPLLLVGAIAFFGLSLGAALSGFLSLAVVLACPVGMYFMMRMMRHNNK